jgi:hypothetical protein
LAKIQINIDARRIVDKLNKLSGQLPNILESETKQAGSDGVQVAKGLARVSKKGTPPNPPGYMRDHIHFDQVDKYDFQFKSDAHYTSYQDMGTRYISGTHFMSEGRKTILEKAKSAIQEDIGALVKS